MSEMWKRRPVEKYRLFFLDVSSAWNISLLFTLLVISLSIVPLIVPTYLSDDLTPDSLVGYTYAIVGMLFMLLAAVGYSRHRRSRRRRVGQLNSSLHWHISFGMVAIVLLCLHSFGNFNPRSGTYALYSMVALVMSGIIGRVLDRIVPKLIAHEVTHMPIELGDYPVELYAPTVQSTGLDNKQESDTSKPQKLATPSEATQTEKPLMTVWDLAYISLEETLQAPKQHESHHRIVPDHKSNLREQVTLIPDTLEHPENDRRVRSALHREEYYRAIISYWRIGHIVLVFVTLGLVLWHLEYAATLLFPGFFR